MHTLSVFPALFDFQLLAALFLRVALAYALARIVWQEKKGLKTWSLDSLHGFTKLQLAEIVVALFLFIGLYTQIATILAFISIIVRWSKLKRGTTTQSDAASPAIPSTVQPANFHEALLYSTLAVIALSLLVLGAGFLAFDLPL